MRAFALDPALSAWLDQMDAAMASVDWMLAAQMPQYGYTSLPTWPPLPPPPTDPMQLGVYNVQLVPLLAQAEALTAELRGFQPTSVAVSTAAGSDSGSVGSAP